MALLLHVSGPSAALVLAAALEAGVLGDATRTAGTPAGTGPAQEPRVLVLDSSTPGGAAVQEGWVAGLYTHLATRCHDLADAPLNTRSLPERVAPSRLFLDPAAPRTASAVARAWPDAAITLHGDGLAVLSPTPSDLDAGLVDRAGELLFTELLPGLRPLLLLERDLPTRPIPLAAVGAAADRFAGHAGAPALPDDVATTLAGATVCLALAGPLPNLGKAHAAESTRLAGRMVRAAQDGGATALVLAPSPGVDAAWSALLQDTARTEGLRCAILPTSWPAEVAHALLSPRLTVAVASPALPFLQRERGARVRSVATGRLLPRLDSASDPARIPLAVIDATLRRGVPAPADEEKTHSPARLQRVLDALGFGVAPQLLPSLREEAARTVRQEPALRDAYLPRKRLKKLRLVGRA